MDFMTGHKTLPLTYDPFFKMIFNPDIHSDRLSRLISSIISQNVEVVDILPLEDYTADADSLLIMDILVRLKDGSLANVEVQKIPYTFPAERMSCYSADLLLRQYNRLKAQKKKNFKYSDLKKVYTIIFYETSPASFKEKYLEGKYIHHGKTTFDTGLSLDLLQEYFLISLDVFRKNVYPRIKNEQTGWISLLATDSMDAVDEVIKDYPWTEEIYREMSSYMNKPEEVLNMFSEALKIMDRNTVKYMMDEMQDTINELQNVNSEQQDTISELQNTNSELQNTNSAQQDTISQLQHQIRLLTQQLNEKNNL
jgi:hypothetical protein